MEEPSSSEMSVLTRDSLRDISDIRVTLMMETLSSSETSVLTTASLRYIPDDGILHSHWRENLKSETGEQFQLKEDSSSWSFGA
jgi:hypothetical protein